MAGVKGKSGGARPGTGMKKGTKLKRTLEKEAIYKEYKNRVMQHADKIFNAQITNAVGNTFIYKVENELNEKGKKTGKRKHVLVTDQALIKEILDENNGESGALGEDYYMITTAKPDNQAIGDMLDRAFGRATQTIAGDVEKPLLLAQLIKELKE
jgi:hypothetical protein